jgi:trans-aconitate 2-methyltransferase
VARIVAAADAVAAEPEWRRWFAGFTHDWYFAAPQETEDRLKRSGFVEARCWLQSVLLTPQEPIAYLETMVLGSWIQRLPAGQQRTFTELVAKRLGDPITVNTVRLNLHARRR